MTVDTHHPVGGAHHQKIVVIDDCLAFAGGIDVTTDRWDTSEHLDRNQLRRRPSSHRLTGPWHDVTSLVSGPAARAIGDLARERWESGTGRALEPVEDVEACWPDVEPLLTDVDVAISRTRPEHGGTSLVHEIELLWLAVIAAARRSVYIESQYFANRRIAEAIAERLREPDGPEFVVVNPETAEGWLQEKAMGTARAKLLALVREADVHGRFQLYVPVTEGRRPIYVHAKVTVVDDRLLRIGSSNLNNRSMGMDTECDVSIEVRPGDPARRSGPPPSPGCATGCWASTSACRRAGRRRGRGLRRVAAAGRGEPAPAGRPLAGARSPRRTSGPVEQTLADTELLDAERTPNRWRRVRRSFRPRLSRRTSRR
jgi:phosphatidylserine/phosphatidylglycerophosphate/cardiolipin synthase-like enzyme